MPRRSGRKRKDAASSLRRACDEWSWSVNSSAWKRSSNSAAWSRRICNDVWSRNLSSAAWNRSVRCRNSAAWRMSSFSGNVPWWRSAAWKWKDKEHITNAGQQMPRNSANKSGVSSRRKRHDAVLWVRFRFGFRAGLLRPFTKLQPKTLQMTRTKRPTIGRTNVVS